MSAYLAFVERLAALPALPHTANPYAGEDPPAAARRANLCLYLERMAAREPRVLLVGEAPGYRGCRETGVPFTSEASLLAADSPFGLFSETAGFQGRVAGGPPRREATATVLWETLAALGALPLLWNACPLHPHRPGRPDSNRPPSRAEVDAGEAAVRDLLALYAIGTVVAVGNKADAALRRWGIPAAKVRHPGHGGKRAFARELAAALGGAAAGYGSSDEK